MKEYTIAQLNQAQAKLATPKAPEFEVKEQVASSKIVPMYFSDTGARIIEQVKEEVVKTNVTKVNFKAGNMNITSVTHVENESEFLM